MGKRELGTGIMAVLALAAGWLLPVTFPTLSGQELLIAWGVIGLAFLIALWLVWHREHAPAPGPEVAAQSPPPPAHLSRPPEGIFQHGRQIGTTTSLPKEQGNGVMLFDEIRTPQGFDGTSRIEWRDYILSPVHVPRPGTIFDAGAPSLVRYLGVRAKVIGRVNNEAPTQEIDTSTFVKAEGTGRIDVADSYSTANTFFHVTGDSDVVARRNEHEPRNRPGPGNEK